MSKGLFISMEGIDGSGKSLQINLLASALSLEGYSLYITKEPGDARSGSNIGMGIRSLLFGTPGTHNLASGVADLLFLADHIQNSYDINKALDNGQVVISDRYADSQFAYSAASSKGAPEWVNKLFEKYYGPIPDLTILLNVRGHYDIEVDKEDISWALRRANARRGVEAGKQDGKKWNDIEEQRDIQNSYLAALSSKPRTFIVDVYERMLPEDIHNIILTKVRRILLQKNG